jgi:hypothetical protein
LESRIKKLEESVQTSQVVGEYDCRSDYNEHLSYVRGDDGSCMDIPALNVWPDEASLWASRPAGTRFIRLNRDTAEIVGGVERPLRFKPVEMTPDAQLAQDELLRDLGVVRKGPTT